MRVNKPGYDYQQSPLFKLASEAKLASLLRAPRATLRMSGFEELYRVWPQEDQPEKLIKSPRRRLRAIHKRIHVLLSRIHTPEYLFSGVKGRSSIDNAFAHRPGTYVVTMDIARFYESCSAGKVFKLWHGGFRIPADLAQKITRLSTYEGHIPRGACHSQHVAFWAYKEMFDEIDRLSTERGYKFSLYVDDMTFSSPVPIPGGFYYEVGSIVKKHGLRLKKSKLKWYAKRKPKLVTGCIINHGELRVPNRRTKDIIDRIDLLKSETPPSLEQLNALIGRLNSARQIETSLLAPTLDRLKRARRMAKDSTS